MDQRCSILQADYQALSAKSSGVQTLHLADGCFVERLGEKMSAGGLESLSVGSFSWLMQNTTAPAYNARLCTRYGTR